MNNTFYFLRHGHTKLDPETPVSRWVLSDKGHRQAKKALDSGAFSDVDVCICSGEVKAFQTIKPIADFLGLEVTRYDELSELNRDASGFMDPVPYEEAVAACLQDRDVSVIGWEKANDALARFTKKVAEIDQVYEGKSILIAGHAYTINMYFASLLGQMHRVFERLHTNDFCSWGVVKNGKVVKDIASN